MIYYVIPARKGSKGFPHKNRVLFDHTADIIPDGLSDKVIVTSDDLHILEQAQKRNFLCRMRPDKYSQDDSSIREVLIDVIDDFNLKNEDLIVLLYLTYPQRTWQDVVEALNFFDRVQTGSLLCRIDPLTHPYLCMYENKYRGIPIIDHNFYRRQDYPKVFEISHFIGIFQAGVVPILNKNLYDHTTVFMPIKRPVDVDYQEQYEEAIR